MNTQFLTVDPNRVSEKSLQNAGRIIREGGLVAFPTETVYGLGANALDAKAVTSIFDAKGRPHDNPLIVHVAFPEDCALYADTAASSLFSAVAERFMPGPITVILPKKTIIPDEVSVSLPTVALRCPSHPVAHALICAAGVPIAAPSANRSGRPSPTNAAHVKEDMDGRIDMLIDGGPCTIGLESTVISLIGDEIHLLRPGFVTAEELCEITPKLVVHPAVLSALKPDQKVESPGMKYRHYAPHAPVTMVEGREEDVLSFFIQKLREGCGILCFEEDLPAFANENNAHLAISFGSRADLLSQAQHLFSSLRSFDATPVSHIYARCVSHERLGLAVSNRLLRAAAFDRIMISEKP